MNSAHPAIDPVTREIIQNALASAADEMAVGLYRTAYSTIVRDCLDFSTSLCDANGEMIAQGVTIPLHLGSVPFAMETLFQKFGDAMETGDLFILNDPFDGGMHIPDIFIVKPVFWDGQRVAFAVSTAHHLDMGGRLPGSSACDNTEIFQDGLRIPWLKLYRRGEPDEAIFALLRANVRVPHMTLGDVRAQVAACHIGERAIHDMIRRYGPATFRACTTDLLAYTERLVRAEIASWPDGSHTFTDYMDSDGVGGPPTRIQVTITVEGDSLTADFSGSSPQVRGALNSTLSFTTSVVALCVRCALQDEIPNTAGMFRPLKIIAPHGSVVHVKMPGASSMRGVTGFRVADAVFGALAGLLPDRIIAAGEGGNTLVIIGGERPDDSSYVYYELMSGTWGARPGLDGNDGLCNPANVASNIPVEQAECGYPVHIERYGLVQDSGGAGQYRGGLAIEREWRLLSGEAHLAIRSDRRDHLPYGLHGGRPGSGSINILSSEDEMFGSGAIQETVLPTMISTSMRAGQRLYHRQPGGGGWGDPLLREPAAVAWDVKNEKVSLAAARRDYGVVLDPTTFAVDESATASLRAAMLNARDANDASSF
jgi:N-methylhydantoinase B